MGVMKTLMFLIVTLTLFAMVIGGMSGILSDNQFTQNLNYFKDHNMPNLLNYTYLTPNVHGSQSIYGASVDNLTSGNSNTYWIQYFYQVIASDSNKITYTLSGGDNVYLWMINNPASLLPGEIYRHVEIIIYQNWGIASDGHYHFTGAEILANYNSANGYSQVVSSGLSMNYILTVIPDANTSLSYDLDHDEHYSVYISLNDQDTIKATSSAWGMISKITTFSMPNWNPTVSFIIGGIIDGFLFISVFMIVRSFIPTLGDLSW